MEDLTTTVENVWGLAKLLSEYGPYVIMGAIFILAFVAILGIFLKMNNQMLASVMKQIDSKNEESKELTKTLLNKVIESEEFIEKKDHEHHNKDLVTTFIGYRGIFYDAAFPLLHELNACRVAIYLFHNGNSTAYGFPFIKTSCVFDINAHGAKTLRKMNHNNIPLHAFADIVHGLSEDEIYYGNLSDDIDIDGSLHQFLASSDSVSAFMKAILSKDGTIAGFSVCEFRTEQNYKDSNLFNKINETMRDMNQSVKYIVTNEEVTDGIKELDID